MVGEGWECGWDVVLAFLRGELDGKVGAVERDPSGAQGAGSSSLPVESRGLTREFALLVGDVRRRGAGGAGPREAFEGGEAEVS